MHEGCCLYDARLRVCDLVVLGLEHIDDFCDAVYAVGVHKELQEVYSLLAHVHLLANRVYHLQMRRPWQHAHGDCVHGMADAVCALQCWHGGRTTPES